MSYTHELNRRLVTAKHEATDADRVWRLAMAQHERAEDVSGDSARRRLDALWQERERAHLRVLELQWHLHSKVQRQRGGVGRRVRAARDTIAVARSLATGQLHARATPSR